jgi:hypothetical protein
MKREDLQAHEEHMRSILEVFGLKYKYFPGMICDKRAAEEFVVMVEQGMKGLREWQAKSGHTKDPS